MFGYFFKVSAIVLAWFSWFFYCFGLFIGLPMALLGCFMVLSMGWHWFSLLGLWGCLIVSIVHQYILVRASGPCHFFIPCDLWDVV